MNRAYLLTILTLACSGCQAQHRNPTMEILFYRADAEVPVQMDVSPTPIRPAGDDFSLPPPAKPREAVAYMRPYANDQRNGRIPLDIGDGLWETSRTVDLNEDFPAQFVLYGGAHILVQQQDAWQLFDREGEALGQGAREQGDVVLDPEHVRFYTNDYTGFVKAWDLSSGERSFLFFPMFGRGYDRSVLALNGQTVWLAATELPVVSHRATRPPEFTILEMHDLGRDVRTDEEGMLLTNRRVETLMTRPVPMRSASGQSGIVLAARDHLIFVDDSLKVSVILQGTFSPMALSLDEIGNAYLVVTEPSDSSEDVMGVWGVGRDGQRFLRETLSDTRGAVVAPPLIGYDRAVTVLFEEEAVSIDPRGGVRWRHPMGGPIAGGVVTADDQVVITAGPRVLSVSADGERRPLLEVEDDVLQTAAVPVSGTRLYVASASTLYLARPMQ